MRRHPPIALFFALALVTLGADAPLSPEAREAALKAARDATRGVTAVQADFTMERRCVLFPDVLRSEGTCRIGFPDRLRWEVFRPYYLLLIYDGKEAAKFDLVDGAPVRVENGGDQVIKEILAQIAAWSRGDFSASDAVYELSIYKKKNGDYRFSLVPRDAAVRERLRSVELLMSSPDWRLRQVRINETDEDYALIAFRDERRNIVLPPETFSISRPARFPAPTDAAKP